MYLYSIYIIIGLNTYIQILDGIYFGIAQTWHVLDAAEYTPLYLQFLVCPLHFLVGCRSNSGNGGSITVSNIFPFFLLTSNLSTL